MFECPNADDFLEIAYYFKLFNSSGEMGFLILQRRVCRIAEFPETT